MALGAWIGSKLGAPQPVGPEIVLRTFTPDLDVLRLDHADTSGVRFSVTEVEGGWRFVTNVKRVFHLFDVHDADLEQCILTCRAELRSRDVERGAYLELQLRVPGDGTYFSKGTHQIIKGDKRWTTRETYFPIRPRQRPDKVSLNFTFDGPGVVEMRNLQLVCQTLPTISTSRRAYLTTLRVIWRTLRFIVLMLLNIILFGVSAALGGDLTWWPKRKAPLIGESSG